MRDYISAAVGGIYSIRNWVAMLPAPVGFIKDPGSGLYVKRHFNRNVHVLAGISMGAKSIQYGHADAGKTIRYMALGSGSTYPTKNDTALVSEIERLEIASWNNDNIASDPVVMIATKLFNTDEANGTIMEGGLFQESTGAPMYCRGLLGYGEISGATNANPCVITSTAHGLSDGDKILIENVVGMTELNDNSYYVDVLSVDTFALYSDENLTSPVNSTGYGTYSEGSPDNDSWKLQIPKTSSETLTINYTLTYNP